MASSLQAKGYDLVSGGTDNHLILCDLRPKGLNGAKAERMLELVNIALNKNTVPGDLSALSPGGIRLGTPALVSRGFDGEDFKQVVDYLDRGVNLALDLQTKIGTKNMAKWRAAVAEGDPRIDALKTEVSEFAKSFPPVGFTLDEMLYNDDK